jgi:hypothetical protein
MSIQLELKFNKQSESPTQSWLYKYNCIVNKEYPEIALELDPSDCLKVLKVSTFNGKQNQRIDPVALLEDGKF